VSAHASSENQVKFATAVGNIDVADQLPTVKTPTIVFHCIHDHLIPFSQGRSLACAVPNATLVPAWTKMMEAMETFLKMKAN
jgi:hypothetical protein